MGRHEEMVTQPYRDLKEMIEECGAGVDNAAVGKARSLLAKMRADLSEMGIRVPAEIASSLRSSQ